jgi:NAD(P)-dependent dehydrogenase (short-subunit alcohol dehydrogenase family)
MAGLSGKTVLITGSTDGVGRLVATQLGGYGARVFVHGRDQRRGAEVVAGIEKAGGEATFLAADFASLAEVHRLAAAIGERAGRLDILINNAGIGTGGDGGQRQTSVDGHELRFAVNYLAGFLLTRRLMPLLQAAAPARIVTVASAGQQAIDFDDIMLTDGYSGTRAYCQSKLAQIMFTFDLAEELAGSDGERSSFAMKAGQGVTANALHPATYMNTTMVREAGIAPWSRVEDGAEAILRLAVSPHLEGKSGLYFNGLREARADPQAYDRAARRQLKAVSEALVRTYES